MSSENSFTKQIYEEFPIYVDFGENLATAEIISTHAVTAVDNTGTAITTILGTTAIVGTDQVSAIVKAGTVPLSPFTLLFKIVTSTGAKWQFDVEMFVT